MMKRLMCAVALLALTVPAAAQDKAAEIMKQMREALGGSKLSQLKGLSLEGPFRREMGQRQLSGTMALTLQMPDRMVPWLNGRVLVGATVEDAGFDERATAQGVSDLLQAGCALVPQLWQASFIEVRVGLRPATVDGLPVIGKSTVVPGLVYAAGHYRNGVLLAPLTAALVRDLVLGHGDDPALQAVSPARFGAL